MHATILKLIILVGALTCAVLARVPALHEHHHVGDVGHGEKHNSVLLFRVPEHPLQAVELLEAAIDRLVPRTSTALHPLQFTDLPLAGDHEELVPIRAPSIRQHLLVLIDHEDEIIPGDAKVRPCSTWEWTINPDNLSSLNADSNLVSQTSRLELVAKVLGIEWNKLL